MKKRVTFANLIKILLAIILLLSSNVNTVFAESTVRQASKGSISDAGEGANVVEVDLATATSVTSNFPGDSLSPASVNVGDSFTTTYTGVNFFGKKLNIVFNVVVREKGYIKNDSTGNITLYHDNVNKRNYVGVNAGVGAKFEVTTEFFDENNNPYRFTGLLGFYDPDESNYLFNTSGRDFYYIDNDGKDNENGGPDYAADGYVVRENGLYNSTVDGIALVEANYDLIQTKAQFWTGAKFFVALKGEDTFTFEQQTISSGNAVYPFIYSWKYNITYDTKGGTNHPENPTGYIGGESKTIQDPTRPGFRFLGWTREDITDPSSTKNDSVQSDDLGDKKFIANWEKINYQIEYKPNESYAGGSVDGTMDNQVVNVGDNTLNNNNYSATGYKFVGWNTVADGSGESYSDPDNYVVTDEAVKDKEENAIVGTLYAQWEPIQYTVKYDPNGGTGHMDDQTPLNFNQDYNLDPNTYVREGYSWVGWNTSADKSGQDYVDKEGFRNLTTKDGDTVTMYAQWEPWKYYVKYEPNGGEGTMNPQTFLYPDPTMKSKENQFTRSGYEFIGFEFEHKGAKYIITSVKDFKDMLKELGPNSTITLVAQWRKLPDPVVKYYNLPVTGVDR